MKVAAPAATIVTLAGGPAARQRAAFALVGRADRRLEAQRPGRDLPRTVRTAGSVRRTVDSGRRSYDAGKAQARQHGVDWGRGSKWAEKGLHSYQSAPGLTIGTMQA